MPVGGAKSRPNDHVDTFFNVRDYGAIPGDTTGSVDAALEAIRNYALNVRNPATTSRYPNPYPIEIYFPDASKTWILTRTCFLDQSFTIVSGRNRDSTNIGVPNGYRHPMFVVGVARAPAGDPVSYVGSTAGQPVVLTTSNFVDAFGKLDTSAVAASGTKWGLNLNHNAIVTAPQSPFSQGASDGWASDRKLTVDFAIDFGSGQQLAANDMLFGMGQPDGGNAGAWPWYFKAGTTANKVRFYFATTGANQPTAPAAQYLEFSLGSATGFVKVSFQINLITATAQAFVNGQQVAVTASNGTAWNAANNLYFWQNKLAPFNIGKLCLTALNQPTNATVGHTYYGLRVANEIMYADAGVGGNQVNAVGTNPGVAPTDKERYFDLNRNCVGFLDLSDPPPGSANYHNDGRCVTIKGVKQDTSTTLTCVGFYLYCCTNGTPVFTNQVTVRRLSAVATTPVYPYYGSYGQAIAHGAGWETTFSEIHAVGGGVGIGQLNTGSVFTIRGKDLYLGGGNAGWYGFWQGFCIEGYKSDGVGRAAIRLASSYGVVSDTFIGNPAANTEAALYIHGGDYGGEVQVKRFGVDSENGLAPTAAAIVCEGSANTPTSLRVEDLTLANAPDGACGVLLKDANPDPTKDYTSSTRGNRTFTLDGYSCYATNIKAVVSVDGTLWGGEVKGAHYPYGIHVRAGAVPLVDTTDSAGRCRVVATVRDFNGPPRRGKWLKGCARMPMQCPVPGQPLALDCAKSGTYNTATPPRWSTDGMYDDGSHPIGGYLIDHSYIPATALT